MYVYIYIYIYIHIYLYTALIEGFVARRRHPVFQNGSADVPCMFLDTIPAVQALVPFSLLLSSLEFSDTESLSHPDL